MLQVLDSEAGAWECVATSVEQLEALGAELAQSAKRADQDMSYLVHPFSSKVSQVRSGTAFAPAS